MDYIISTVQCNASLNKNLVANMYRFADEHEVGKILIYVMPGKYRDEEALPEFDDERVEFIFPGKEGIKLNTNLKLHDTKALASAIKPFTGLPPKLGRCSYIIPSPKIRFISLPSTSDNPRFFATTGALTHGNYKLNTYRGRQAQLEHQYGFAYVKVHSNRFFDYRMVKAKKNGNFHFYSERYRDGVLTDRVPEVLILGDWHCGNTHPLVREISLRMIHALNPVRVVWHDLFNGHSICHHELEDQLARVQAHRMKRTNLENELRECYEEMSTIASMFPQQTFMVAESNHDIFLKKYLSKYHFQKDAENAVVGCKLFASYSENPGRPILETALAMFGDIPDNVVFFLEKEEHRVRGVNIAAHGHNGPNGSRGSASSFSNYNLLQITGHSHRPEMYPNGMSVGTSTHTREAYMKGPGASMNAHGLLYDDGEYVLHIIIPELHKLHPWPAIT